MEHADIWSEHRLLPFFDLLREMDVVWVEPAAFVSHNAGKYQKNRQFFVPKE